MVAHAALTGAELHEPKGADGASANTVYIADGAGSGDWNILDYNSLPDGTVIGHSISTVTANTTVSTNIPLDDTIPQSTEGYEFITVTHTPKSTTSILVVEATVHANSGNFNCPMIVALFKDTDTSAVCASLQYISSQGYLNIDPCRLVFKEVAGSTSARTYKIRVGPGNSSAVTTGINQAYNQRFLGGIVMSSLRVTEFKA